MNSWLEYAIVFIIVATAIYYVWTRVLFKKSSGCKSGCGKCG